MYSDRELLELAAKAYGYDRFDFSGNNIGSECTILHDCRDFDFNWNPLIRDSDALSLVEKLQIDIEWRVDGQVQCFRNGQRPFIELDTVAGLRRAIVRAAAEIGRLMP